MNESIAVSLLEHVKRLFCSDILLTSAIAWSLSVTERTNRAAERQTTKHVRCVGAFSTQRE